MDHPTTPVELSPLPDRPSRQQSTEYIISVPAVTSPPVEANTPNESSAATPIARKTIFPYQNTWEKLKQCSFRDCLRCSPKVFESLFGASRKSYISTCLAILTTLVVGVIGLRYAYIQMQLASQQTQIARWTANIEFFEFCLNEKVRGLHIEFKCLLSIRQSADKVSNKSCDNALRSPMPPPPSFRYRYKSRDISEPPLHPELGLEKSEHRDPRTDKSFFLSPGYVHKGFRSDDILHAASPEFSNPFLNPMGRVSFFMQMSSVATIIAIFTFSRKKYRERLPWPFKGNVLLDSSLEPNIGYGTATDVDVAARTLPSLKRRRSSDVPLISSEKPGKRLSLDPTENIRVNTPGGQDREYAAATGVDTARRSPFQRSSFFIPPPGARKFKCSQCPGGVTMSLRTNYHCILCDRRYDSSATFFDRNNRIIHKPY